MPLAPHQAARIRTLLDGGWADQACSDEQPEYWITFDRLLAQIESPEELHAFADQWNWDRGTPPMRRVLDHSLCDRGTALMIYWRIDPVFFLNPKHDTRKKVEAVLWPDAIIHWDILRQIERRLAANDFRSARIPFDPTNDHGRDRTKQRFRKKPPVPLFKVVNGQPVQVGVNHLPEDPEFDAHASLPPIVFQPVIDDSP